MPDPTTHCPACGHPWANHCDRICSPDPRKGTCTLCSAKANR